MSPITAVPGSASKDYKSESTLARLLGSGTVFNPFFQRQEINLTL
jgi:hypothetical protein